jgi:biotin operon repressor
MHSEAERERLECLREKHAEGLLLRELENGFELSPRASVLVFETAKGILLDHRQVERGRVWVVEVVMGESAGKSMRDAKKREVRVTVDGGREDVEYQARHGRIALRGMRMLRIIEEGINQGVVFSEEDLGRVLGVSVRTVKRDVRQLREDGCEVQTRGYYEGIGRAISHKARIVELYLQGRTYAEIENRMRHTMQSIKRYVEMFGRVLYAVRGRKLSRGERSYVLGISEACWPSTRSSIGRRGRSTGKSSTR